MSAGLVSSEGQRSKREYVSQASLLASGGLQAIFGVPWLVNASPWSLPACPHSVLRE